MSTGVNHHDPHLAHHFDNPRQQYESGKQGMWLFLATEVLLFGGLFCAYSVYRSNHPDIFYYGHQFLSVKWGGINTVVLICSSLTMAWAVRAAQLGHKSTLVAMLSATLLLACGFLGIKAVEYAEKWKHGLLWASQYEPQHESSHLSADDEGHDAVPVVAATGPASAQAPAATGPTTATAPALTPATSAAMATTGPAATGPQAPLAQAGAMVPEEHTALPLPAPQPQGLVWEAADQGHSVPFGGEPRLAAIFFSIYFIMTGLHGIHVLGGMAVISWLLVRALKGHFGAGYFAPVDFVGLYWHLVDLIWIYLFPLLYLIH